MVEKNKRKLQAEKTKKAIIESITQMVSERPISQLTIREICSHTGISPGAFYHHFDSKEAAILFSYQTVDYKFEELARDGTPLQNIRSIIALHLGLISWDNINSVKSVYISHLVYYDEYFFRESRPIFVDLKEEISAYLGKEPDHEAVHELAWKLLRFCRGMMYNACIDPGNMLDQWPEQQTDEVMEYFLFQVNKLQKESLR
ncbi:TetR/AcrR family transcriptional regulator [Lacrimispora aerotolerans]|jgi:AcrR family transcriptional regulator|uniref:TetR/AcrR family transcriptional regulator n=1 Tax=Lacrimispora aerotolerans TaxID=36832 RepID=UPI00047CBA09|nr:TetR/AcrR family transcriptional regulator [Lacrimispora aerotolerans]